MPNKNKNSKRKTDRKLVREIKDVSRAVKSMRVSARPTRSKLSLAGLAGLGPASLNFRNNQEVGVAFGKKMLSKGPLISTKGRKIYSVSNSELVIPEISGSTTFAQQARVEINPGLASTFAWLSQVAVNYAEYRIKKMIFRYITRSPTTKSGSFMMTPLYDPLMAPPTSEQGAAAVRGTLEGPIWTEQSISIDRLVDNAYNKYFVRDGPVASDLKTYDPMLLVIYTNDCADSSPVGKLYVDYEIDFFEPVSIESQVAKPQGISAFNYDGSIFTQGLPGSTTTNILWDHSTLYCNSLGVAASGDAVILPKGCYIIRSSACIIGSAADAVQYRLESFMDGAFSERGTSGNTFGNGTVTMFVEDCVTSNGSNRLRIGIKSYATPATLVPNIDTATLSIEICSN